MLILCLPDVFSNLKGSFAVLTLFKDFHQAAGTYIFLVQFSLIFFPCIKAFPVQAT